MNSCTYEGRLLRCGYTLLLLFTAQAQPDSPDRTASVHGTVTNTATGEGLRKAYLRLIPAGSGGYAVVTNDQGTFAIENIAPGNYQLSAECTGFLDAHYGMEFQLSARDKLTGIEVKMVPQAVLSGRVLDQDGDPWPRAHVNVFHSVWRKGHRHIEFAESTGSWEVDDRGEFRITGLSLGRYYVLGEPDTNWEEQHHPDVNNQPAICQQPTWYPSSPDVESASPITLAAGDAGTAALAPELRLPLRWNGSVIQQKVEAVYENGVFRPLEPVSLQGSRAGDALRSIRRRQPPRHRYCRTRAERSGRVWYGPQHRRARSVLAAILRESLGGRDTRGRRLLIGSVFLRHQRLGQVLSRGSRHAQSFGHLFPSWGERSGFRVSGCSKSNPLSP